LTRTALAQLAEATGGIIPADVDLARPCLLESGGLVFSYGAVAEASAAFAHAIAAPRRQLAFALVTNDAASVLGVLAAMIANCAIALVDPVFSDATLARLIETYAPDLILQAETRPGHLEYEVAFRVYGLSAWRRQTITDGNLHPELFVLLSTSGTTGAAKFVRLSQAAVTANAHAIAQALSIRSDDVAIAHLPLHYSYGMSVLTSHLTCGAAIFLTSKSLLDPCFWKDVQLAHGSHFPGVPFHYTTLLRLGLERVVPTCVRTFTQAGGRLNLEARLKLYSAVNARGARLCIMYGQTEAAPRITTMPAERFLEKAETVGPALSGGRLLILDEDGASLSCGTEGEIVYVGPNVMMGYAEGRADLARGDEMHGRLRTGDRGRLDSDGYLTITGRNRSFAKVAGLRISLDDVEAKLKPPHDVALVPGAECVVVFHSGESDVADLKARVVDLARTQRIPPASYRLHALDAIPTLPSGKIDFAQLRALA